MFVTLKPCQNKKGQKHSRFTILGVFFSAASRKMCTCKSFWPFLFCEGFRRFLYLSYTVKIRIVQKGVVEVKFKFKFKRQIRNHQKSHFVW